VGSTRPRVVNRRKRAAGAKTPIGSEQRAHAPRGRFLWTVAPLRCASFTENQAAETPLFCRVLTTGSHATIDCQIDRNGSAYLRRSMRDPSTCAVLSTTIRSLASLWARGAPGLQHGAGSKAPLAANGGRLPHHASKNRASLDVGRRNAKMTFGGGSSPNLASPAPTGRRRGAKGRRSSNQ
jgi:hypothetical protein